MTGQMKNGENREWRSHLNEVKYEIKQNNDNKREREKERKRGRERKKLTKNIIMIRERETETERGKSCLIGRWCRKWSRVVVLGRGEWFRILSHFQGFQRLSHSDESFAFAVDVAGFLHQDLAFLGQQGSFHVSQRTDDPALEVVDPSSEAGL